MLAALASRKKRVMPLARADTNDIICQPLRCTSFPRPRNMSQILVLGAGMIGTCTALHLVRRGHDVTLIDRRSPGRETSYGNAGMIQREAMEPYPFPEGLGFLLRAALKAENAVNYHPAVLPAAASAICQYRRNSRLPHYAPLARAYGKLIEHSIDEHAPLIAEANADDLVSRDGYYHLYRSRDTYRDAIAQSRRLAGEHGLQCRELDGAALHEAEPALRRGVAGAIHWQDAWAINNPGELVARYAALFEASGGKLVVGDADTLKAEGSGWSVQTEQGRLTGEHAVVALGPWSDGFLRSLGYRYPLFVKRGYHRHYRSPAPPRLPFLDADRSCVVVPMQQGVRITTGAELAPLDAPSTPVQLQRSERYTRELIDLGDPVETDPWRGARPCTADLLPVIGPAPRHPGLWFNFGHAHQGFTLGPVSGRLMTEMINGETPFVDPAPYRAERFG